MTGHDISTLNSLISTTLDSSDGYRRAAEVTDNAQHKQLFLDYAADREHVVRDLQAQVRILGGEPEDDGTVLAAAHRAFLTLRDAVSTRDDAAVISEVERGEDHLKSKYNDALDGKLDPTVEDVVRRAYQSVREGHDRMSNLKHQMQGEAVGAGSTATGY